MAAKHTMADDLVKKPSKIFEGFRKSLPAMVSLHVEQVTPEAPGMDIKTRASSSPDEHGSVEPRQDEPSPTRPRANEPDPRDPRRVSGPPQIIKNHGRHAIVASDLSRQIHGELHTSQLGTFSGESVVGICKLRKDFPYLLYSQS